MSKYSDEIILEELSRICASDELKSKYRLCHLLNYLVNESLSEREGKLKSYTIGIEVFQRDKDFNPELDPIVRIQIGRLRRAMDKYYSNEGKNDSIRISIPKGNYSPKYLPNDESFNQIQNASNDDPVVPLFSRPSIIVTPFANLTGEKAQEYFATGITEEISIELTRFEDFRIIGYTVNDHETENNNSGESRIQNLGANFIIQGSIRKNSQKIKINVKLLDAYTSEQLWAEQYTRDLNPENLISIQEEIAHTVVFTIANEYGIIPQRIAKEARKKAPKDFDTYDAILKYYHYQAHLTPETAQEAFIALNQAINKEPESGIALSLMASLLGTWHELDLPDSENAIEKVIELTNRAIELEPDNQAVRIVYAWSYFIQNDKEVFFSEIQKALSLNRSSPFRIGTIGFFLSLYGDWENGKKLLDEGMNKNVGYPHWFYGATTLYHYRLNDFETAYTEALKYDVPSIFWGPMLRIATLGQLNRKSEADRDISDLKNLKPDFESKARYLISRYVKEDELVEKIIEGLRKAGLEISE